MSNGNFERYNIDDTDAGLFRQLAEGMSTRIFAGDHAMLSVVSLAPGAMGTMHQHPEEQWGLMLEGSATRYQGDVEFEIVKGDFWRTPPNIPHTMKAGPKGAKVLDIFAPVRADYLKPGSGFSDNSADKE